MITSSHARLVGSYSFFSFHSLSRFILLLPTLLDDEDDDDSDDDDSDNANDSDNKDCITEIETNDNNN